MVVSPVAGSAPSSLPSHKTVAGKKKIRVPDGGERLIKGDAYPVLARDSNRQPSPWQASSQRLGPEAGVEAGAESSETFDWSRCGKVSREPRPWCQGWMLRAAVWRGSVPRSWAGGQSSLFQVFIRPLWGEGRFASFCCGRAVGWRAPGAWGAVGLRISAS